MNLLGRKKTNPDAESSALEAEPFGADRTGTTAPKGRPTPKRSQGRRGPVAPAPMTAAEARRRRKEVGGPKLSRAERKAESVSRRAEMADRREKMMAGEDAYLLPRDKGPVRRYIRDLVDSRRISVLGLFMPSAIFLLVVTFGVPSLVVQKLISPAMLLLMVIMAADGLLLGRRVNKLVDEKFPTNTESAWKLGFYAASRATQLRRMRAPRPQVSRGEKVT